MGLGEESSIPGAQVPGTQNLFELSVTPLTLRLGGVLGLLGWLLVAAEDVFDSSDGSEEAMRLLVWTSRKEECVGRA